MHSARNRSKLRKEKESVDVLACIALALSFSRVCSFHSVVIIDGSTLMDQATRRERSSGPGRERERITKRDIAGQARERETRRDA